MNTTDQVTLNHYPHSGDTALATCRYRVGEPGSASPHVMFCGGFHSTMQGTKAMACMQLCQKNNWNCTLFDYRGHGQSDGQAEHFTLSDWLDDTLAVLDEAAMPTCIAGSSMGAWLATLAALRRPETVSALLLLAAAPDFLQELVAPRLSTTQNWELQQGQTIHIPNNYDSTYPITQALLDSATRLSLFQDNALMSLHCPVRMLHGVQDADVPFEFSTRLLGRLSPRHDARLTLLNNADHRLSDMFALEHMEEELARLVRQTQA